MASVLDMTKLKVLDFAAIKAGVAHFVDGASNCRMRAQALKLGQWEAWTPLIRSRLKGTDSCGMPQAIWVPH
jgi:hypothetical protein